MARARLGQSAYRGDAGASVNILKMCVGVDEVAQLVRLQASRLEATARAGEVAELLHLTRHVPRRAAEITAGGSLYWVIKGFVRVRQRILRIDPLEPPVRFKRCAFVLSPRLVRTELQARRPHQGWRYLEGRDAPADLARPPAGAENLPAELASELRALGLL